MIKAILFDLDDTLIVNPPERFTRNYVLRLVPYFYQAFPHLDPETIGKGLRASILGVIADKDPLRINRDVFYSTFTQITGITEAEFYPVLLDFFKDIYASELHEFVEPREASQKLARWLFDQHYAVAVATNPLFERDAVLQRMGWGGITLDNYPFWFITTLENSHFTKPNLEYFEEVLSRLGFEPDQTLMIGDDWENDIVPAWRAGLNTYWVTNDPTAHVGDIVRPDGVGTMDDLFYCITKENWLSSLVPRPLTSEQIIPRLRANIAALMGLVSEIPDRFWHQRPDPNEWSPMEIVVHLRDRETPVQRARLQHILSVDNPFISPPETPPAPGIQDLLSEDGIQLALDFARERQITLDFLAELTSEQWMRPARHSVFGPTSLLEMASFTARHDRLHINQLCQTLGKCE
jgi:FMN phosphatase YigB (HAD superfamily)